ncbi:aminoglycoside phosphotransferase family protein [Kribbella soli]|uniref:aminoglycoside phosphotransferase family protein n=1 Tax=Kribbella soli TaxID=1124743 RepID=UPI0013F3EF9F|nr:aminoglycoside phosphotransferase family protein [Kribbella soli]
MNLTAAEVSTALGTPVHGVEVVETFAASAADVARLLIRRADGSGFTVIAKLASGAGRAAARREVQFFEQLAPKWDHPAPQLVGASDTGDRVLLLTEDLGAAGYCVVGTDVTDRQLHGAIDVLAGFHSRFWNDLTAAPDLEPSVTNSAQAWPPEVITRHAAAVRSEADSFFAEATELTPTERAALDEVITGWERQFQNRVACGRALTLIHGDFHFLGNIFFADGDPRPKIIDWSELKPGLGPHDLAYSLSAVPARQPAAQDLLRYYWEALDRPDYSWELCRWDFRFSVISNLFQSVFQRSVKWYRASLTAMDTLDSRATLTEPPPT